MKRRFKNQILRIITGNKHLRQGNHISPGVTALLPDAAGQAGIARDIAHSGVTLCQCHTEPVSHVWCLFNISTVDLADHTPRKRGAWDDFRAKPPRSNLLRRFFCHVISKPLSKTNQLPPQCALLRYHSFHVEQRHHIAMAMPCHAMPKKKVLPAGSKTHLASDQALMFRPDKRRTLGPKPQP